MLAIADPSKEDTESLLTSLPSRTGQLQDRTQVGHANLLTSLPSRTGQLQDRTQVGHGQLANKPTIWDRITVGEVTGRTGHM
jgi:hypothetical protein